MPVLLALVPMKKLFGSLLIAGLLSGCLVRTNNRGYRNEPRRANCGPGYHWDGYNCVHNGRARGRDHRR